MFWASLWRHCNQSWLMVTSEITTAWAVQLSLACKQCEKIASDERANELVILILIVIIMIIAIILIKQWIWSRVVLVCTLLKTDLIKIRWDIQHKGLTTDMKACRVLTRIDFLVNQPKGVTTQVNVFSEYSLMVYCFSFFLSSQFVSAFFLLDTTTLGIKMLSRSLANSWRHNMADLPTPFFPFLPYHIYTSSPPITLKCHGLGICLATGDTALSVGCDMKEKLRFPTFVMSRIYRLWNPVHHQAPNFLVTSQKSVLTHNDVLPLLSSVN